MSFNNPKVQIIKQTPDKFKFRLHNVNNAYANALRRVMLSEVPSLAIDLVQFYENDSVLHNEMIAHRIGLLVLNSDIIDDIKYAKDCNCDGCKDCSIRFTLDIECMDRDQLDVTAGMLESDNPLVYCVHKKTIITKLARGQKIKLDAIVRKGVGKTHSKWSPVCTVGFKPQPIVTIKKISQTILSLIDKQHIVDKCCRGLFEIDDQQRLVVKDNWKCKHCDVCVDYCKDKYHRNLIDITDDENTYQFVVNSTECLPPQRIVKMALRILQSKFKSIEMELYDDDE